jgi:putative transposase
MRRSKFSDAQFVAVVRDREAGVPMAEILRKQRISRPTFSIWKSKYGSAGVPQPLRLKSLEQENVHIKRVSFPCKDTVES